MVDPVIWVLLAFRVVLFVVGIPGNLLVILVYRKRKVGGSTRIYIMAMAASDLTVCLISPAKVYERFVRHQHTSEAFCKIYTYQHMVIIFFSLLLMMMIAADRYIKICLPNKIRTNAKRAMVITASCLVLCVGINARFLTVKLHPHENGDVTCGSVTEKSHGLRSAFTTLVYMLAFGVAFMSYGLIYRKVRQQVQSRKGLFHPSGGRQIADDRANSSTNGAPGPARPGRMVSRNARLDIPTVSSFSGLSKTMTTASREVSLRDSNLEASTSDYQPDQTPREEGPSKKNDQVELLDVSPDGASIRSGRQSSPRIAWAPCSDKNIHGDVADDKAPIAAVVSSEAVTNKPGHHKSDREKGKSSGAALDKTTKMMLMVTVVYVVTWIPESICRYVAPEGDYNHLSETNVILYVLLSIIRELFVINYVINPVVYGLINKRFREDAFKLVKRT